MFQTLSTYPFYKFIDNHFNKQLNQKNLILEPISCIMKVILLQHKQEGNKFSVNNNAILFNEPSLGQGFLRSIYGDCREDLHNLYYPILRCVQWYSHEDPHFKYFYQECKKGLLLLIDVYDNNSTIHHTLSHYISIIEGNKDDNLNSEKINPIIDTLHEIWTPGEINASYDLLMLIQKNKNKDIYLKALEDIVTSKESFINDYIQKISTTY